MALPSTRATRSPTTATPPPWWKRRRPLTAVFGVTLVAGIVIVSYPYLPLLTYSIAPPNADELPYASRLARLPDPAAQPAQPPAAPKPAPNGNRLVIPKIGVDIAVVDGADEQALLRGAWRIPGTSDSPMAGNMVVSAHRFRYRPPASETFYLLDKLKPGDLVILYWKNEEYDYRVSATREVNPDAVEILNGSDTPQLTLFTCTPLFSTARRLVVTAEPA